MNQCHAVDVVKSIFEMDFLFYPKFTCILDDFVHNVKMVDFQRYDLSLVGKRGNCHFYCLWNNIVEFLMQINQPERQHSKQIVMTVETGDNFPFYSL